MEATSSQLSLKEYRDKPSERLRFAIENLPLPGAFHEAAVALRSLIKAKKKRNEPFSGDVACLYWLAAIASFSMPYSQRLAEPGFNVLQPIPGTVVASLPFTYRQLGHQRLSLLNKTDVKWIEAEWDVPSAHSTLLDLHRSVWELYEEALVKRRDSERKQFIEDTQDILPRM